MNTLIEQLLSLTRIQQGTEKYPLRVCDLSGFVDACCDEFVPADERGMTLDNVVRTTVLLADINDFAAVNEVYGKAFSEPYPVRCAYEVANLPAGGLVEIEVLATA